MLKMQQKERMIAFMAGLICIVAPFVSDSYVPSLPAITHALGSTSNQIQLTLSLYFLGAALAQLVYGPLSDRYGRRLSILLGLGICTIGSFLCALSGSAPMLIAMRFLQGIGAGACNGLFRAILRDTFNGPKLAQIGSYIGIIYPLTYAAAPVFGGYIQALFGWHMNFLSTAFIVITALAIIWRYLPETHQQLDASATRLSAIGSKYLQLLCHPKFMGYSLISSFAFAGFVCYYTAAPFLLQNIVGLSPVQFGWLSVLLGAGTFISQYLNGRFVMQYGIKLMLRLGILLMVISGTAMLALALFHFLNAWVIVMPVFVFSLAAGFVFANAMAGAFDCFGHMAGTAGALYGFLQMISSVFISMLLAKLHENTQLPLSIIFAGIGLCTFIVFYGLHRVKPAHLPT